MRIYLDNAATTKMSKTAINAMLPYMDTVYGNLLVWHSAGQSRSRSVGRCERPNCKVPWL